MTVSELLRRRSASAGGSRARFAAGEPAPWTRPVLAGAASAVLSGLVVVLPALVVWVANPASTVSWPQALGVGSALWLLGSGAHLRVDGATISLVPLALTAMFAWSATAAARRMLREMQPAGRRWLGLVPRGRLRSLGLFTMGYAGCAAGWALLTLFSPLRPTAPSIAIPVAALPAAACAIAAWLERDGRAAHVDDPEGWSPKRLPRWLARAVRPALEGVGAMLGLGLVVVVGLVFLHIDRVSHLQEELRPDVVGGLVLVAGQAAALPNLGLWAVSFMSGAGFSVVEGAQITWSGAESGLMPLVPVLGALPPPGAFPGWVAAGAAVPVGIGVWIGWRARRRVARLSRLRSKAAVSAGAVTLAALGLSSLDALGGGALGMTRLADLGAPAHLMGLYLLGEFALGASFVLLWDAWRVRR
jgi:Family of unknown function (DUF6350)